MRSYTTSSKSCTNETYKTSINVYEEKWKKRGEEVLDHQNLMKMNYFGQDFTQKRKTNHKTGDLKKMEIIVWKTQNFVHC